ncbi:MAG: hypothetical protein ACR2KW_12390 [Rubrobacter sp.]
MSFLLSAFGVLLLILSIALISFGIIMAFNQKTRSAGKYLALWWVPGAAAASGVIMRDSVTFIVGGICFLIAGAVFLFENRNIRIESAKRSGSRKSRRDSEHAATEIPSRDHRRRAS